MIGSNELNSKGRDSNMVLPTQAMGLNDNLDFFGKQLHVQTENAGFPMPRIITQVFSKGRIILSRKSEYPADEHKAADPEQIQELMRLQHYQIIREISEKQQRLQGSLL